MHQNGFDRKKSIRCYDGKLSIKDAVFLTQQELNRIEEKPILIERLQKVRDMILLQVNARKNRIIIDLKTLLPATCLIAVWSI